MATKKTTTTATKTTAAKTTATKTTATKTTAAKTSASKATKAKATPQVDFSDSINAIKDSAKVINSQVREVTAEVIENIKDNSEPIREMTITPVREAYNRAYNRVSETINMENISKTTKEVNEYTQQVATDLIDGALETGEKWQGIASKAVKGGLKLADKQQEMVFETLEAVKEQVNKGTARFRKLFSNN